MPALPRALLAKMFVEIPVVRNLTIERKSQRRKSLAGGLPSQMRQRRFRRVQYGVTSLPHTVTKIHVLVIIEKLFVKAAQLFQQLAAKQNKATRRPAHRALRFAVPAHVLARRKPIRNMTQESQSQRRNPFAAHRRKRSDTCLIRAVGVQHLAPKPARLGMPVGDRNHLVNRSFLQIVRVHDVRSTASPNSHIVCPRKPQIPAVLNQLNARIIRAYEFDGPVGGPIVGNNNLKVPRMRSRIGIDCRQSPITFKSFQHSMMIDSFISTQLESYARTLANVNRFDTN